MMSNDGDPVSNLEEEDERGPRPGIGLAVSGGGYRAMLFHLGAFLRLFELGLLKSFDRISSVSGGSITAAKLALEWPALDSRDDFVERVVRPIRALAGITVDRSSIIGGLVLPGGIADRVSAAYAKHLFGEATLQNLPDSPRFVINATNVESCALWRFSKPYMRDYKIGKVANPTVSLADAVTASSAFPPFLSPFVLEVGADAFSELTPGLDPRHLDEVSLTDGGVYDNLGLETVWKKFQTVLVSDAGGANELNPTPPGDWARHAKRVLDIVHEQVSHVRKRQVIDSFLAGARTGAYWGIRSDIAKFGLPDALPAPNARTMELARTPTRLKRLEAPHQERLINWGYAVCDAAIRRHWPQQPAGPAPAFPYPKVGV